MLNKIFQRGHQTDLPLRTSQTCIPERGRSDRLDWAHARINLRQRIAFFAYGELSITRVGRRNYRL